MYVICNWAWPYNHRSEASFGLQPRAKNHNKKTLFSFFGLFAKEKKQGLS